MDLELKNNNNFLSHIKGIVNALDSLVMGKAFPMKPT